jgi:hypothetical protein
LHHVLQNLILTQIIKITVQLFPLLTILLSKLRL